MDDSAVLDALDRQLVRALQLDPRAAFSRVAEALDVSWVTINAGGAEVVFALRARTEADRDDLLVRRLPRSTPVLDISGAVILHRYLGANAAGWEGLRDTLTPEQVQRLTATPQSARDRHPGLDAVDHIVLDLLARDGRTSYAVLARSAGISVGRVMRRVAALQAAGVIYFDLDIATAAIGDPTTLSLWLTVAPRDLDAVGRAVAAHDEVQFAAALTGPANLVAAVTCADLGAAHTYVTTTLAAVDGITGYELSPVMRRVKQAGALIRGDRLADPPPVQRRVSAPRAGR
jgi:DNA-binding Lrp family transcriptional regulator